jgi:hypothetical protein
MSMCALATRKIRGHIRIQNRVERWRRDTLSLPFADSPAGRDRYYAKILVHPWNGLSMTRSSIPEPAGKTKQMMLAGLLDIHDGWKVQLDRLGLAYYLRVWIFEPRFSRSQVVCAFGDSLNFYEGTFHKPDFTVKLQPARYGRLKEKLSLYNWDFHLDEDFYDKNEVGERTLYDSQENYEAARSWFMGLLKKPHRTEGHDKSITGIDEAYFFQRGHVWVGEQK